MSKKIKSSRSKQAGLSFPVVIVGKKLKKHFQKKKFKKYVDVRMTAVLEYAIGQLLQQSAEQVVTGKYITPEHISKVVKDEKYKMHNFFSPNIVGLK